MRGLVLGAFVLAMVIAGCGKDDTTKPAPTIGACCAPAGACTVTTQADCAGTWTEAGVCLPNSCTQPPSDMVRIPAGTFTMGSPADEAGRQDNETQHQVTLTKFIYVSKHEITQTEWQNVMGWNESDFKGANRPVEEVTWFDALKYCNERSARENKTQVYHITDITPDGNHIEAATVTAIWSANGYRLLTEAEWEYTCRAGSATAFCNGGITNTACGQVDPNLDLVGWYCGNAGDTTHEVGGKAANAWGLEDMHGNVWEWCWDWKGYWDYPTGPVTDPLGAASGDYRVIRGGGWLGGGAQWCRSAARGGNNPDGRSGVGLRVARAAE
jgi:formylglycine-generating enzyme required for sulfatase activity